MNNYLFPHHYRRIGWWMVAVSLLLIASCLINAVVSVNNDGFLTGKAFALIYSSLLGKNEFLKIVETDWATELIVMFFCVGSLLVGFSRERDEDECIATIRFQALTLSLFVNTVFVVLTTFFVYGLNYIYIMYFYSFSILAIFIAIYYWKMYQFRKNNNDDGK